MIIRNDKNGQEYFNRTCPYCKENVRLYRSLNDAVMFDKNIYHTDCFLESKQIQKKCKKCKRTISFQTLDDIENTAMVFYQGSYYCNKCFLELCSQKTKKWKNAKANFDKYVCTAKDQLKNLLIKKFDSYGDINQLKKQADHYVETVFIEHDINSFICTNYGIIDVSNFYIRYLKPLYNGTLNKYPGVSIPPKHLIEMWRTKISYLNKVYQRNINKGKKFTPTQHALYDIAILIGKYEGFLEWKNKQLTLENSVGEIKSVRSKKIDYTKIKPAKSSENIENIDDILNDIFN